ncbi:outer membrane protein OmpA-like peptidoglycan-associated protein [Elusimicrobium simillimum]|uniref:hypothetical protein n=1 Tax=Elusimicrobium simillimum TaxID=3143438 RepID=UPI003C6FCEF0
MAEKKDSFTFSDKLKDSKPAPVPFSKRFSSSKVGTDGKPKKTFFERTKRDAPFFIAALVVLLLLPLFIKFTGPAVEPGNLVGAYRPISGDEPVIYDDCLDANGSYIDGCTMPLSSRSSIDWLRDSLGGPEPAPIVESPGYNAYAPSETTYNEPSYISTVREQTPNIVRGAAVRPPTVVGRLGSAEMATARGRVGGNWSPISAKAAEAGAGAVRNPAKPVSLQPLNFAGRSDRPITGEAAAAEARRSLAALNKQNAREAIRDAQMTPQNVARMGGLTGSRNPMGGGGGAADNKWGFKGQKPWWWDMEMQKHMKKWEYWFKLWGDPLKKIVDDFVPKFACCILTGQDDCEVDKMWGTKKGEATPGMCRGVKEGDEWKTLVTDCKSGKASQPCPTEEKFPSSKPKCKRAWGYTDAQDIQYDSPKAATNDSNFFQVRFRDCFGWEGAGAAQLELDCNDEKGKIDSEIYTYAQPKGKAEKWNIYQYVVVNSVTSDGKLLCGHSVVMAPDASGANSDSSDGDYLDSANDVRTNSEKSIISATEVERKGDAKKDKNAAPAKGGAGQESHKAYMAGSRAPAANMEAKSPRDCVMFVRGGRHTVNNSFLGRYQTSNQSDQGRIFREYMIRQHLVNNILPGIYGCQPEAEIDTTANDNKVSDGRNRSTTEAQKNRTNFTKNNNSCHDHLGKIFVKYVGAVAMEQPLAVDRKDINPANHKPVRDSYIPELAITWADFSNKYLKQVGNDYRKTVSTVTNVTRKDSQVITSNMCEYNKFLGLYNPNDYCLDEKDDWYYNVGTAEAPVKGEPVPAEVKKAAASTITVTGRCANDIEFYPEEDPKTFWKINLSLPDPLKNIVSGTGPSKNIGKCCTMGEEAIKFTVETPNGTILLGPRFLNRKTEGTLIKQVCATETPANKCDKQSLNYKLYHVFTGALLDNGTPVKIEDLSVRPDPYVFIKPGDDPKTLNKGTCCVTGGKVYLTVKDSTGQPLITDYEISEDDISEKACSMKIGDPLLTKCGSEGYVLVDKKNMNTILSGIIYYTRTVVNNITRITFVREEPGVVTPKGTCCKDKDTNVVKLTIDGTAYELTAESNIPGLCKGQENDICPYKKSTISSAIVVLFDVDQYEANRINRGKEDLHKFVNALIVKLAQEPEYNLELTVEGHTDWSGKYNYNKLTMQPDRKTKKRDSNPDSLALARAKTGVVVMQNYLTSNELQSIVNSLSAEDQERVKAAIDRVSTAVAKSVQRGEGPDYCSEMAPSGTVFVDTNRINLATGKPFKKLTGTSPTPSGGKDYNDCRRLMILVDDKLNLDVEPEGAIYKAFPLPIVKM